jgi:hypothetical protein
MSGWRVIRVQTAPNVMNLRLASLFRLQYVWSASPKIGMHACYPSVFTARLATPTPKVGASLAAVIALTTAGRHRQEPRAVVELFSTFIVP